MMKKIVVLLEMYDLFNMLRVILGGFGEVGWLVEEYVMSFELVVMSGGEGSGDMVMVDENGELMLDWGVVIRNEEIQWDFMVDVMDWEVV